MLQLMGNKVVMLTEKVDILSHRSIRGKLMSYFRIQSTKTGELSFSLPFSLLKLANYLCIDRSAMMREIKKMKEEELIAIEGKRVTLAVEKNKAISEKSEIALFFISFYCAGISLSLPSRREYAAPLY